MLYCNYSKNRNITLYDYSLQVICTILGFINILLDLADTLVLRTL